MSALGETLLTACALSSLAAFALARLPHAPPRLKFAIAVTGLAAWLVPWGAFSVAVPRTGVAAPPLVEWLDAASTAAPEGLAVASELGGYALGVAFALGLLLFARDCLALRRCARVWRARSRRADELRAFLPRELAAVEAEIRLVEHSNVAAASGVWRPTIWLGSRHSKQDLALALVHEMWHVRARDPLWLIAIAFVRRAYWWNPLVAHLARAAVLALEAACDDRCAARFGKTSYAARLAALLLTTTGEAARLAATVRAANLDVERLRLLGATLRLRVRDLVFVGTLAAGGTATVAAAIVEPAPLGGPAAAATVLALPETPPGDALRTLLAAANSGNSEVIAALLGAFTPQELRLPLPPGPNLRVLEVLREEPFRIEYVVAAGSGARYVGEIAVDNRASPVITATRLRRLH